MAGWRGDLVGWMAYLTGMESLARQAVTGTTVLFSQPFLRFGVKINTL
jgi:hypothetical protein